MYGDNHRQLIFRSDALQNTNQVLKLFWRVNVLFAVRTHHEITIFSQAEPRQGVGAVDFLAIVCEHFVHGTAGLDDPVWRDSLAQEIFARDVAVWQIDVADMVDNLPVDLFGYPVVEAAVPGF